jgi:hypothetical protein
MSNPRFEFRPSGSIEFEQVEPEAVARELNAPDEDTPDGPDADPLSINFGRAKDFKPSAIERMLAGTTIDWLIAFPPELRPKALCDRFHHVANRLASDWSHKPRSAINVQALATDTRWGSAGFPALVQGELQQLLLQLADFQPTE